MREHYEYQPEGVCTKLITFDIEDGKIYGLHFLAGCPGNLAAISRLLEGADAMKTIRTLRGNRCGHRMTSCADQRRHFRRKPHSTNITAGKIHGLPAKIRGVLFYAVFFHRFGNVDSFSGVVEANFDV